MPQPIRKPFQTAILAATIIAGTIAAPDMVRAATWQTDYTVSFSGLPIARSSFTTKTEGDRYTVTGNVSSAGIGSIFASTNATARVTGVIGPNSAQPASYKLDYTYNKKAKSTAISYGGGAVSKTVNTPPPPERPNWVPVEPGHLVGATDPLNSWMIVAKSRGDVCRRTIKFFDGELRANIQLSPAGSAPFMTRGFEGDIVRCSGRIQPVSGYRKGHKSIDQLKATTFEIGFAQLDGTNRYAPVTAKVRTAVGTVSMRATRMEKIAD